MARRGKKIAIMLSVALCAFMCALCIIMSGCDIIMGGFGNSSWDISKDSSSAVTATLVKRGDSKYTLKISGKGYMQSWESKEEVPWNKQVTKINKVEIGEGVLSVGSNAFSGIAVSSLVLPESVLSVGKNFVSEDTLIFAYSDEIEYAEEDLENIYLYSEEIPRTGDRYWQSDKSAGDIFDSEEELFAAGEKYWHFDDNDIAEKWEKTKVLFIGNSFTYRNGVVEYSSGVPGIFDKVAEDLGYYVETYSITGPGWYLENHAKETDTCGKQVDKLLKACDDFDYVVLQEQSTNPFENYNRFLNGVKALQTKINNTQDHAKIFLYETWGSPFSANERKITVPEMESKLREAYMKAAAECDLEVSYVGKAFTDVYKHEPSIYLYASDNRHQGYTGAYLSGCVHVGSILGADVRDTNFVGESEYRAPDLGEATLTALRNAAYNAVFGEENDDEKDEGESGDKTQYSLEIAVWGRWITEAQFVKLYDGFKQYCADNNISADDIHYTYYVGATNSDPYYYIANFTGAVVVNGGADIVFPCATNLTTQSGTQITSAEIAPLNITLNGKTDRCVAKLTETDFSNAFFDYCATDGAKVILDPSYTPAVVDQKKVLVVACWGRFMKEEKFKELIADFKAYCDENNVEYIDIIANYYVGAQSGIDPYYNIAPFTEKVLQDGNTDIVLPCADNFNANQSNLAAVKLLAIDVYGQTNRRVAALNAEELTEIFFTYIQTASAQEILSKAD